MNADKPHYTDAEKIKRLTAWHEADKKELAAQAATIAQLREALEKAANELWDKHFKAAKAEWATDDVARKYADAIVDEYRTAARALKGGE